MGSQQEYQIEGFYGKVLKNRLFENPSIKVLKKNVKGRVLWRGFSRRMSKDGFYGKVLKKNVKGRVLWKGSQEECQRMGFIERFSTKGSCRG
jgi:hypothetical protein